jgi:hypothetical protein
MLQTKVEKDLISWAKSSGCERNLGWGEDRGRSAFSAGKGGLRQ